MIDLIKESYWNIVPYDYRPSNLWQKFLDWSWYRYTVIHPRTLPGFGWTDRDHLLVHSCFEILTQFMEKELKGYKEEDWKFYYTQCQEELVEFGGHKKDPYYVLDYLMRWWRFYLEKEEKLGDAWHEFNEEHSKLETSETDKEGWLHSRTIWDTVENEQVSKKMFKRYSKKCQKLEQELENNLVLLIRLRKYLWT